MRKLIDQLTRTLSEFRNQRDNLMLLVACSDSDVALLVKVLRELDRNSASDLYFLFSHEFTTAGEFVDELTGRLQSELSITNEQAESEGQRLPPLPDEMLDQQRPADERLLAGLKYAKQLIDIGKEQKYFWGMGPQAIRDPQAYLKLLNCLAPRNSIEGWMRGGRIVARVPTDFKLHESPLADARAVTVTDFVIPASAHEDELRAVASDPNAPLSDRMQAEVQLAYIDSAHSRWEQATERFRRALAYYQWASVPEMQGLIICGLGDIARRQRNWKLAHHYYSSAVSPITESGSPILWANVVQNLASIAAQQEKWDESEQRYTELARIKRSMFDEVGLVEALEQRASCQWKQDAFDRAVCSWEEAAVVCQAFNLTERLHPTLVHLRRGYERLGLHQQLENFEANWRT